MKYAPCVILLSIAGCGGDVFTTAEGGPPGASFGGAMPEPVEDPKNAEGGMGGQKGPIKSNQPIRSSGGSPSEDLPNLGGSSSGGSSSGGSSSGGSSSGGSISIPDSYEVKVEFDEEFLSGNSGTRYQYAVVVCDEGYSVTQASASINFIFHMQSTSAVNNLSPSPVVLIDGEYQDLFDDPHHPLYLDYEVSTVGENPCDDNCPIRSWAYAETAGGSAYNSPGSWYEYNTSFLKVTCKLD